MLLTKVSKIILITKIKEKNLKSTKKLYHQEKNLEMTKDFLKY